jgi:late competence protein required for DNA uptake (superfamily II DNA/RNA helicase)
MKGDYEKELEYMESVIKNTTTEALIAELENRSNCKNCAHNEEGNQCLCIFYCRHNGFVPKENK